MKNALIIMMKNPVKGKVKTRLANTVGDERALAVYFKLMEHTKNITIQVQADKFIFYSDVVDRNDIFDNTIYKKYTQCSGDLGLRMDYAFSIPFKNEYKNVVMIGADCYELTAQHIETAFTNLQTHDFAIGPAADGGYYLIAMKKWNRWVLQKKHWSTAALFEQTKAEIENNNASLSILEMLHDLDTAEDLLASGL